ncbi:sulfatase [Zunongwangia sp. F363]|uniref:Sulfatase n=1 Tax=Autumnicola tepida TaxID=3075595 RepID=A0ABU3C8X4_9FLAO|nr:sulfatase [Zunongwangia sp. F363]MDT0642789.1 sulfatase [Zunongwangia sp. F363]
MSLVVLSGLICNAQEHRKSQRPNILFAISDDQSFAHTSFVGCQFVNTPVFDKVAREGVYFANCIAGSPGCAPSRSSIITGRYPWQNEQSGQHASAWLKKYVPFIDVLERAGYSIGRTGKGVDPFQYARNGKDSLWRETNAAGILHSDFEYDKDSLSKMGGYASGIKTTDYFGNFKYFVENEKGDKPFFFWFGAREPHRPYEKDSYKKVGKDLKDVRVPGFLPDNDVVKGDLLDYVVEVEWFDRQLGYMLEYLEEIGELENTIVIVTSDNGKPFPSVKANAYEYGIHVPMAIRYPRNFSGGRVIKDPVSFVDIAPTILDIAGASPKGMMMPITGKSFLNILKSKKDGYVNKENAYVFSGRERHSSSRYKNWGYPQRALRSRDYLFIWNMKPDRWPAGAPQEFNPNDITSEILNDGSYLYGRAYTDIDGSPTKDYLLKHADEEEIKQFLLMAVGKRPEFELFDINKDPYCLNNLADSPEYAEEKEKLKAELIKELNKTKDPRIVGPDKEIFDSYKRYSHIRKFPEPGHLDIELNSER